MAKVVALALGLLLSGLPILTCPVFADTDAVKWSRVNIPTQGKAGGWLLASGADIQHPTIAGDILYAYGKGLTYTLYQSQDQGRSWSAIGRVKDIIVDIAVAPDNVVYYATASGVFRSADGVSEFVALPTPGGAGTDNIEITSLDVRRLAENVIVAGTRDTDIGEYGGVYLLDEASLFAWTDTGLGGYDVYAVDFSPNYSAAGQLIAVASDETDTLIAAKSSGGWGGAKIENLVPVSASVAFPEDYNPSLISLYFVAIDSGVNKGDVYRVENSVATDLNIGVDITSLALSGYTTTNNLFAGAAASAEVYFSTDGGRNWQRSVKPPTGQSNTYVVFAQGKVYATTSGTESALSYTTDGGFTWNQISMIDTTISEIVDLAPSPDSEDNAIFMLSSGGGKDSLWRSLSGGKTWERVLSSALADINTIEGVQLPPQYASDNEIVFIAGSSSGNPLIWQSTDDGQTFNRYSATLPIDTWAVVDNNTLFLGSFDGSDGLV